MSHILTQEQLLREIHSLHKKVEKLEKSLSAKSTTQTSSNNSSGLGYKVYTALLTQTGTNAPVATVLENTLSGTPVWSYGGAGFYTITLAGEFVVGKTVLFLTSPNGGNAVEAVGLGEPVADYRRIKTYFIGTGTEADDLLNNTAIEIRVYP